MDALDEEAAAALEGLADPVRVRLLRTLWDEGRFDAVTFSALREATAVSDSGRFNYHLQRLTDTFVERTDEGYRLRPVGIAVVDVLKSGVLTPPDPVAPTALGTRCPRCESALSLAYDRGFVTVSCGGCDRVLSEFLFPPRGVTARDSPDEVAAAFDAHVRSAIRTTLGGVCPYCGGRIAVGSVGHVDSVPEGAVTFAADCADCRGRVTASAATLLSFHPAVVSFLHDRGVDTREPVWGQEWYHRATATIHEQPDRHVEVNIPAGDETLRATVDVDGTVREVTHLA